MTHKEVPGDKKLVIYCRSGRRSADTAKFLSGKGCNNVYKRPE
ncbi:MAG: rhodanese-like domain-containing protein [Bacillota bacterium]